MGGGMKPRRLIRKSLAQFIVCVVALLLVATPAFYWLTKNFYAEDIADLMEALRAGRSAPTVDLEEDIIKGTMLQFGLIVCVLGVAVVTMVQLVSARLWRPFDRTLEAIESFRLESGACPVLPDCDVEEFNRLNHALERLMRNSMASYHAQKEFAENASHEMQTPLAIFRSKLDLLLQLPGLSAEQAAVIQDLYRMNARLSRLNRSLLLLARIDNGQYDTSERVDVVALLREQAPTFESLACQLSLVLDFQVDTLVVRANRVLLESVVSNLVVNAIRHNRAGGEIVLTVGSGSLSVSNTSAGPALDSRKIFNRFYRPAPKDEGNGLGLSIVKAICDCHGWRIVYSFEEARHVHRFTVSMA